MKLPGFAMRGRIEQCWLFVYRAPAETVATLLGPTLTAVTHGDFAFWNIVVCRLSAMRPASLPASFGFGYWHVGYRVYVRAELESRGALEGLFFARSDCDRHLVAIAGNRLTSFNFHIARIRVTSGASRVEGTIESPAAAASFQLDRKSVPQAAPGSPFPSLAAAASALEYKPAALSPRTADTLDVVRVRRDAAAWRWHPVNVIDARWQFLDGRDAQLELCYQVEPVDYLWERAQTVPVRPCAS